MYIWEHYGPFGLLFALLIGHALADFPLQQEFIAQAKNPKYWKSIKDAKGVEWIVVLGSHSLIHGGAVWILTGSLWLGVVETILHFLIDMLRNQERTSFLTDQLLHIGCKLAYMGIAAFGLLS